MVVRPERPVEIYQVGDKVEVKATWHRHLCGISWISAAVVRVVDGLSYVVAYSDSKATEYVHCQFMRKPPDNSTNGGQRRKVCVKIKRTERRQSMPGEMPSSPVDLVAFSGDGHSHDPESSATKKPRKNLKELDGILAEGLDTPLSDRNRNDHVCADHHATQVAKSSLVMKTAIRSPEYRVQKAGVGELDQQAGEKVDDSFVLSGLRNPGSSQSTIENSPLRGCSASESSLPSPMALSNTSDQQVMFVKSSPMWLQLEASDVFCAYPQRPHFLPLKKFPPTMHEGMAVGLMAVFSDLVRIIRKASIYNSMEWFEDKFSTLRHLEEHGFSVQSLHSTLTKLVKIKSQHTVFLGEIAKLDVTRTGALLDEKDRALAELEKKLGFLRQEIQNLAKEKVNKETELVRLKSEQSMFMEACVDVEQEFCSVLDPLPGGSLT